MIVALFFIFALGLNVAAATKIKLSNLSFFDGIFIGMIYYLTIPMTFILIEGENFVEGLPVPIYNPYRDTNTTFIIILFISALSLFMLYRRPVGRTRHDGNQAFITTLVVSILYILSSSSVFLLSGIMEGGHWAHSTGEQMSESVVFLGLKFISTFTRMAVFPCLAVLSITRPDLRNKIILAGIAICLFDVFSTFNRITILYLLLVMIIIFRDRTLYAISIACVAFFCGISMSHVFSTFRGLVSYYGYSRSGLLEAWATAAASEGETSLTHSLNGVFESSNISMLNYIVNNYDSVVQPFGTYFLRPLTILIPRSLMPDRPEVFGLELGEQLIMDTSVTLNSTLIGEPYANSWLLWPLFLAIMIAFYNFAYKKMSLHNSSFNFIGAFTAISLWRFDASYGAVCLVFSIFLILALATIEKSRGRPAHVGPSQRQRTRPTRPSGDASHRRRRRAAAALRREPGR